MAYAVIIAHAGPLFGFVGIRDSAVPAFFIISGFYMQLVLSDSYSSDSGIFRFYTNRALRILPSYWFVIAVMAVVALLPAGGLEILERMHDQSADSLARATDGSGASLITAVPNLFIFGGDVARLFCKSEVTGHLVLHHTYTPSGCYNTFFYQIFPPVWSLSNELTFYLFAPFFARLDKKSIFIWILMLNQLDLQSYLLKIADLQAMSWHNADFFLIGMFACKFYISRQIVYKPALIPLALTPFVIYFMFPRLLPHMMNNNAILWSVWFLFAFGIVVLFDFTRSWKWDRTLGDLSYAIYLIHWQFAFPMSIYQPYAALLTMIVSTLAAAVIVVLIERPINKIRRNLSERRASASLRVSEAVPVANR